MSAMGDVGYVQMAEVPKRRPPASQIGVVGWLRRNLFSSPLNVVLTVLAMLLLAIVLPPLIRWTIIDAVWRAEGREACAAPGAGACWAYIGAKFNQFIYGRYPVDERWRVNIVFLYLAATLIPMAIPGVPGKRWNAMLLLIGFPIVALVLLLGGVLGLAPVRTDEWGGLMLTVLVAIVGITFSLPLGIVLALGRRSKLPVVRFFSIAFIEFWRGVPLITVLFMSKVMLPIFFPPGVTLNALVGALIGISLFSSAYLAEVVRGGLQAIARGQEEAAKALGLNYVKRTRLVILPQALVLVIPGIVNSFIALFKDTSLLLIIGIFDFLGTVQSNNSDPRWASPNTPMTGYLFAAIVFWVFCFSMSRYSQFIERRVSAGRRR